MSFYRDSFPKASITPKLHMLEDHIGPFLKRVKVGLGFLGEQGAESIHRWFNALMRNYVTIPNRVNRLDYILMFNESSVVPFLTDDESQNLHVKMVKNTSGQ